MVAYLKTCLKVFLTGIVLLLLDFESLFFLSLFFIFLMLIFLNCIYSDKPLTFVQFIE